MLGCRFIDNQLANKKTSRVLEVAFGEEWTEGYMTQVKEVRRLAWVVGMGGWHGRLAWAHGEPGIDIPGSHMGRLAPPYPALLPGVYSRQQADLPWL